MIALKLQIVPSYTLGDEMKIQIAVLNSAETAIDINSFIDTSSALKTNIFSITGPDGKKIAYHGMRAKGADRSIQLLPYENRLFTVMLAKEYYLSMSGDYTIELVTSNILLGNCEWESSPEVTRFIVTTADDDYTLPAVTRAQEETLHMKSAQSKCEHIGKNNKVCGASDHGGLMNEKLIYL